MPKSRIMLIYSERNYNISHTIMTNSSQNIVKKEKQLIIDWLIEHFPQAFFKKGSQIKPLQIGIFDEIIEFYDRLDSPPFSKKALRKAVSYYSSSPAYLKCQKEGAARVDLYGNEIDVVTSDQAKYAYQRHQQHYMKNHPVE